MHVLATSGVCLLGLEAGKAAAFGGFLLFVLIVLGLDLGLLNRRARVVGAARALVFTGGTIVMALAFAGLVYWAYETNWLDLAGDRHGQGEDAAIQFVTGWLVEYSLSLDNILVIAIIFHHFRVPREEQHRVLFWGVLGALFFRGVLIGAGSLLVQSFHWILYIFGAILLITAWRLLANGNGASIEPDKTVAARLARRVFPLSDAYDGDHFFTRTSSTHPGKLAMTPLFLVLCVIETTDIVFAVDSIPAVFAVTSDSFLVFTSNVFAILGLRSLYFALEAVIDRFRYLKASLVIVLGFIGLKMLLSGVIHVTPLYSLLFVALALSIGLTASIVVNRLMRMESERPPSELARMSATALRHARRAFMALIVLTVAAFGLIAWLAPGLPALPVALVGAAAVLSELIWGRMLLGRMRTKAAEFARRSSTVAPPHDRPTNPR